MNVLEFKIGDYLAPYIIAEIGVNHEGSLDMARRLIDEAAEAGAHAAKFQTYKAEKLASRYSPAYWDTSKESTSSQYALFKKYDSFGPDEYKTLAKHCELRGIHFLSTPFDIDSIEVLNDLVPAFKIASADITNIPLLRNVARTGKPIILSTGASSLPEIELAVRELKNRGAESIALLHCVLNYPTPISDAQLWRIGSLKRSFPDLEIGYSDHVPPDEGMPALDMAVMQGATIIEKHFTQDKTLPGNDHYHAMDKQDLLNFSRRLRTNAALYGVPGSGLETQAAARQHARRSIVASRSLVAGELLTEQDITVKRPAHGISPVYWDEVVGAVLIEDVEEDRAIQWRNIARNP
ncbi:N-acetylneuraminate synthase family protein [Cupriavidus necator]|uniref:N-acetylneuraminate synthase family protein n=1 Tax=Cupriavidus necator TaxID=106590 RepID=UPI003ED14173